MELKKFGDQEYCSFLSDIINSTTELRVVYNNILLSLVNNMEPDTINDFVMRLDEIRENESEIIEQYKNDDYDLADLYNRFMDDFETNTTNVFDFKDFINIYSPGGSSFLRKRHMNLISKDFDFISHRYKFLSSVLKIDMPLENLKAIDAVGKSVCDDMFKIFIKLVKEEVDKDPRTNNNLLFYVLDLMIGNPDLEKYYMDNKFELDADITLNSRLLYEYGLVSGRVQNRDYIAMSNRIAEALVMNFDECKNDDMKRKTVGLMIEAAYVVTNNVKLEPFINDTDKAKLNKVRYLTLFNK